MYWTVVGKSPVDSLLDQVIQGMVVARLYRIGQYPDRDAGAHIPLGAHRRAFVGHVTFRNGEFTTCLTLGRVIDKLHVRMGRQDFDRGDGDQGADGPVLGKLVNYGAAVGFNRRQQRIGNVGLDIASIFHFYY